MSGRDIYWNQTSLLVNGNTATGSGGWDAGPNRLDVTTVGNPRRDSVSPFQSAPGYWSNSFDGSGDYLTVSANTALDPGTGNFTAELWFNTQSYVGPYNALFNIGSTLRVFVANSNTIYAWEGGSQVVGASAGILTLNRWNHLAVVRSGTTVTFYLNGSSIATYTSSANYNTTTYGLRLGIDYDATSYPFNGYLSNFRVVKGTAVYTANFTPPTTALTAITNTVLLTCQDNRFKDNSTNNFTLTATGNVSVEPENPFRGGSVYFDGSGDYLTTSGADSFDPGSGNWTIEGWCYFNNAGNNDVLINGRSSEGSSFNRIYIIWLGTTFYLGDNAQNTISVSNQKPLNQWFHVAVVKNSSTYTAYINGTSIGSSTTALLSRTIVTFEIGARSVFSDFTNGYISNLRIVKGTAVYTSNFTPPGNELTPIANTSLLTCQSPTQLVDYSTNNFAITASGNATVSNAGPGLLSRKNSVYFDGNGDYLSFPNSAWGTQDYTVEFWTYKSTTATQTQILVECRNPSPGFTLYWSNGTGLEMNGIGGSAATAFTPFVWHHIAVTRSGTTVRCFIDGVLVGTGTDSNNYVSSTAAYIGSSGVYSPYAGYISNLRIVVGTAVYTSAFTPTNQPLEAIANTYLLTCQSETIDDTGPNNLALTVGGTPFTSQFNPYDLERSQYGSTLVGYNLAGQNRFYTQTFDDMAPGTGDFTLECWVKPYYQLGGSALRFLEISSKTTVGFYLVMYVGSYFRIETNNTAGYIDGTAGYIKLNQWTHMAFVRANGVCKMYIDGTQQGSSVNNTTSYDFNKISVNSYGSQALDGHISNIRYTRSARYSNTFTPSIVDFQPDSNTVVLLSGTSEITPRNKACFVDGSSNKFAVTGYGNATQSTFSPYTTRNGRDYSPPVNGGSVYLDGTGDYLALSNKLGIGTSDFTVELWYYQTFHQGSFNGGSIFSLNGTSSSGWNAGGSGIAFGPGQIQYGTSGTNISYTDYTNKWTHLALTRKSGILNVWVNGVSVATGTDTSDYDSSASAGYPVIGCFDLYSGTARYFYQGYVSDLRVVKGAAVYQTNFPVPTQPVGIYSLNNATTTLYLPFTSSSIIDETGKNSIEPVGDVKSSTLIKKYNNTSMYFDGNGDYLVLPSQGSITGDFTVEFWANKPGVSSTGYDGVCGEIANAANIKWSVGLTTTTGTTQGFSVYVRDASGGGYGLCANNTITGIDDGLWHHWAACRSGSTWYLFKDGVQLTKTTDTASTKPLLSSDAFYIGNNKDAGSNYYFNGYIDDLRITKGIARYTANFTPPTAALPTAGIYKQPVVTNYQDQGTDLGSKYVTKSYLMDVYPDLIPAFNNGVLYSWGRNDYGQLGDGTTTSRSSPGLVVGGSSWKQVSAINYNAIGIKSDGSLWTWGNDGYGQLGQGVKSSRSSPVSVVGGGTWKQASTGGNISAAIKTDGTLWTWGYGVYGALGTGDQNDRSSPGTTAGGGNNWKQVACGAVFNMYGIKTDGTLWAWGYNQQYQVGDGTQSQRLSPVTTAGGGTNWKQVAANWYYAAAIKTDGTLWTWGYNDSGQLGDGTTTTRSSPVTTAGGGNDWKQVACGYRITTAIKTDGTLWTWGSNGYGQLGDGTTTTRSSPGTVAGGGTNWKQVSTGGTLSMSAIKTDGSLWTWGRNDSGQLGDGTTTTRSSPGTVAGGGTNWKQVSVGGVYNTGYIIALQDSSL